MRHRSKTNVTTRRVESEAITFFAPILRIFGVVWNRAHLVVFALFAAYAFSGTTFIEANQAGVVLRLGAVTEISGEPIVHPPGILFALPKPFDEVLTIDVDRVNTLTINELSPPSWQQDSNGSLDDRTTEASASIDPEQHGYVLTGDRNILHTQVIVRYHVSDPVSFSLLMSDQTEFLRSAILESTIRVAGETRLDDLLGGRRGVFSHAVAIDAQSRLNRIGVGFEIVSIEYENLSPPEQVAADFDAVQSAYIQAETQVRDAQAYAARVVPEAKATAREIVANTSAAVNSLVSQARADHTAFESLLKPYWDSPSIVRQRVYREGIELALKPVDRINFVPAPVSGGYEGTRFSISLADESL